MARQSVIEHIQHNVLIWIGQCYRNLSDIGIPKDDLRSCIQHLNHCEACRILATNVTIVSSLTQSNPQQVTAIRGSIEKILDSN